MTAKTYDDLVQGTPEWLELRRGIVTASTVGQLITAKTVKVASNDNARALVYKLAAERITGRVEPSFQSDAMLRGHMDEPYARDLYSKTYAPVVECGFMVTDDYGWRLGYSPDGLVGTDGLIEIKSRDPKKHLETILVDEVPAENMAQIQAGLLVSVRAWCDYISYCGGMPLWTKRVYPDPRWQRAIVEAVNDFEEVADTMRRRYDHAVEGLPLAEYIDHFPDVELKLS